MCTANRLRIHISHTSDVFSPDTAAQRRHHHKERTHKHRYNATYSGRGVGFHTVTATIGETESKYLKKYT